MMGTTRPASLIPITGCKPNRHRLWDGFGGVFYVLNPQEMAIASRLAAIVALP